MAKSRKQLSPFRLAIDPDEFLERAIRTNPKEVEALIKRAKKAKPPGTKRKRKASGGTSQSDTVVDLRRRRMRKRDTGR
jgi:hypothetical protein